MQRQDAKISYMASKKRKRQLAKKKQQNKNGKNNLPKAQKPLQTESKSAGIETPKVDSLETESFQETFSEPTEDNQGIADNPSEESQGGEEKTSRKTFFSLLGILLGVFLIVLLLGWLQFGWFGMPPGQAVDVQGKTISKDNVQKWTQITAKSSSPDAPPLDGPDYTECVKAYQKQSRQVSQPLTQAEAKKQCRLDAASVRNTALQFLINNIWIEKEAEARGISVSDKQVKESFEERIKNYYPNQRDFQEFKKSTGQSDADLEYRTKIELLQNKLRELAIKDVQNYKPTNREISQYYKKNTDMFKKNDRWISNIIIASSKKEAEQALKAWKNGSSLRTIVDKYSIDNLKQESTKRVEVDTKDTQFPFHNQLDRVHQDQFLGPKKTEQGWMIVKLLSFKKAETQSQKAAKSKISTNLVQSKKEEAVQKFIIAFQQKWKKQTQCADDYTDVSYCKNYKQPKISTEPSAK